MRTTHTRISLLRLAVLYSILPFFALSLLINPGWIRSGRGQEQNKTALSGTNQRGAVKRLINRLGALPAAQAKSLVAPLELSNTYLETGQPAAACTALQKFISLSNALVTAGQLTSAQAQPLIEDANKIRANLGCSAFQEDKTGLQSALTKLLDQVQRRVLHPSVQGGPDAGGYTYITNQGPGPTLPVASPFLDISPTGTNGGTALTFGPCGLPPCFDNQAATATLPSFTFYGVPYTQLRIATNGYISTDLTDTGSDTNQPPIPGVNCPPTPPVSGGGARIYPLFGDLIVPQGTGNIYQQSFASCPRVNVGGGTEPCTVFMWDNADFLCENPNTLEFEPCGTPFDFEVILFHTSGEIRVQVGAGNPDHGATTSTGIQNQTGLIGLSVACKTANSIPDNFVVSFFLCSSISCPSNITVANTMDQCGANVNYTLPPSNSASCSPITCSPNSGAFFPVGTTNVTCTSAAGPTCGFTVTVQDIQPPTINCPGNISAAATSASGTPVSFTVTASDNCPSPAPTVTCVPPSGSTFPIGTTTVTCTASDASPNSPNASCSFNVTVNRVTYSITDPLACTSPGNIVNGSFTIPNTSGASVTVTGTATLPAGLIGQVGSCTANFVTSCVVTPPAMGSPSTVSYTATIPAGQTATVNFRAQVADNVAIGTQLCSNLVVTFGGGPSLTVPACITVNCPTIGPGSPFGTGEVSDQKAGSVLVYNLYSSSIAAPNAQNTRISITNIHPSLRIAVHLFFVDGESCSIADSLVCLTPNQTASFLASDIDPGTTGYIVAVASDIVTGCPVNFNYLIGDEYVKFSSGHAANLAAEAFAALAGSTPICNALSVTALLSFDNVSYNRAPRVVAASNIPSRGDGNDTLIVLNRFGGSLATSAGTLGPLFGILYDDAENPLSFTFQANVCQFRASLGTSIPRTTPPFGNFIPAGRSGWAKFYSQSDIALLGAQINFNPNAGTAANAFNQGHNLHKLTLTTAATLTIPIFPPNC